MRCFTTKDGSERMNPIRNQIDFIITRRNMKHLVINARSYSSLYTDTDHKLVITNVNLEIYKIYQQKTAKQLNIDIHQFHKNENQQKYKQELSKINIKIDTTPQEKWNSIVSHCKNVGEKILGKRNPNQKYNDPFLQDLSKQKQKLKNDVNASGNETSKEKFRKIKSKIRKRVKENEENKLKTKLEQLENTKDDSNRYFLVMRDLQSKNTNEKLYVKEEHNMIAGNEKDHIEIITKYFEKMRSPSDKTYNIKEYLPTPMAIPYTKEEIGKAGENLKNGKSAGPDNLHAELIKYASENIHEAIADIYEMASTGNHPDEVKLGLLAPLQKPNKKRGPPENLRPIILLSIIRKILTICFINRTWERISTKIPADQSAYQPGRSTSEQVLATKLMAEKAINTNECQVFLALFDLSKAFDTVKRGLLFNELENILQPDEIHALSMLTNTPSIKVKVNNSYGR